MHSSITWAQVGRGGLWGILALRNAIYPQHNLSERHSIHAGHWYDPRNILGQSHEVMGSIPAGVTGTHFICCCPPWCELTLCGSLHKAPFLDPFCPPSPLQ